MERGIREGNVKRHCPQSLLWFIIMKKIKYIIISLIMVVVLMFLTYTTWNGYDMTNLYTPQIDGAMEIKLTATDAHLWFEEIISGDINEDIEVVWKKMDECQWYIDALLSGGKNLEGVFYPLTDPDLIEQVKIVDNDFNEWRKIAIKRYEAFNADSRPGSSVDQKFDAIFRGFIQKVDNVETLLQIRINNKLKAFILTQIIIIMICIVLFLVILVLIVKGDSQSCSQLNQLRQLRNYLSEIINSMPSLLICVDSDCKVTQWNLEAELKTGFAPEMAIGKPLNKMLPRLSSKIDIIQKSIEKREQYFETNLSHQNEKVTVYENLTIYPFIADGVEEAVIRIDDVTKEYELEKQLRQRGKMDAIGQLAGGVAHDFNNILTGIICSAQLLQSPERDLDEESLELVDMIMKSSTRAAELTAKLLAFGRKGKVISTDLDMHSIIDDTVAILSRTIDKKIKIKIIADAKNSIITGDDSALQNSLLNLGINASHAMKNAGELIFETKNIELNQDYCDLSVFDIEPGKYIEVSVRDTGCGMNQDVLKKIFEPFFTTKKQGKGTGLGLASVYGIVQDHHGAITAYSEEGIGTTFHIYLLNSAKEKIDLHINHEDHLISGTGKIFLIDDEEIVRITGKIQMEEMGYEVIVFENGLEAIEEFEKSHDEVDLIITDMIMPEINGREIFYKLKEIDKNCKVILSSGFTKEEDVDSLKKDDLAGFIRKPFGNIELSHLLKDVLDKKKNQ